MIKIKRIAILFFIMCLALSLSGCNGNSPAEKKEEENMENEAEEYGYLSNLEDGCFYVLHTDKTYEKLEMPNATFEQGDISTTPSNDRTIWLKEDEYENIPTLYLEKGDKLVYYSTEVLEEKFTIERFEDIGYSVGITGLEPTNSGRYKISTDEPSLYYPDGDTQELMDIKNETLIIDSIGSRKLRTLKTKDNQEIASKHVSRNGSIIGLEKDKIYQTDVYVGTELHRYNFKADVRIMASMAITETMNFAFINDYIAEIEIPSYYNTGYYVTDANGIFRLVTETMSYDLAKTNFNLPNTIDKISANTETSIDEITGSSTSTGEEDSGKLSEAADDKSDDEVKNPYSAAYKEEKIEIPETGTYQLLVNIEYPKGGAEGNGNVKAYLLNPERTLQWELEGDNASQSVMFNAEEPGTYIVCLENMTDRTANCNLFPQ